MEDRRRQASGAGSRTIPKLDLIYYGTANPGPWNPDIRPGDNKWTCVLFARDPDTGEANWFYQWTSARRPRLGRRSTSRSCSWICDRMGASARCSLRAERNGYLLRDGPRSPDEVLSADSVHAYHDNARSRPENRPRCSPSLRRLRHGTNVRTSALRGAWREGLAAYGILAENRTRLHSRKQHVRWTWKALEVKLYRGHAVCGPQVR